MYKKIPASAEILVQVQGKNVTGRFQEGKKYFASTSAPDEYFRPKNWLLKEAWE
ncbi:MAG: hypothetical protein LBR52_04015 [Prevotellaceae bacterium]|nr:hypothetical protein [Prevotellaceae bacterium]